MDLGLKGKWALVGGASKGLGLGCAQSLAREGAHVVIVARGAEALNAAATELRKLGTTILTVTADITTEQGREAIWAVAGGPGKNFDTDRLAITHQVAAEKTGKSLADIRGVQQAQIPAGRFGHAREFGDTCAFLCSAQASYITGQNILMDGGAYPGTF